MKILALLGYLVIAVGDLIAAAVVILMFYGLAALSQKLLHDFGPVPNTVILACIVIHCVSTLWKVFKRSDLFSGKLIKEAYSVVKA